jgi:hypothetical protein
MSLGNLPDGIRCQLPKSIDGDGNLISPRIKFGTVETNRIKLADGVDLVSKLVIYKVPAPNLIMQCGDEFFELDNANWKGRPYELHELEEIGQQLRDYCLARHGSNDS